MSLTDRVRDRVQWYVDSPRTMRDILRALESGVKDDAIAIRAWKAARVYRDAVLAEAAGRLRE